jgi:hypothetical protein
MPDFAFDLPLWVMGPGIVLGLCALALCGLLLVRHRLLPRLRVATEDSEFSGAMLQAVMVFYGLAVALIAVSVWQTYDNADGLASQEAACLAALYRDVSLYPEPHRSALQQDVKDYLEFVIHEAWPAQAQGKIVPTPPDLVKRMIRDFMGFVPANEQQKLQHAEALRALNEAIKATRLRVDAASASLPGIMWLVIGVGALLSLSTSFFFKVQDARLHGIMVVLLASFMGLIIFMILALDRPFRGELGVRPDAYQIIYDQLIVPSATSTPAKAS